MGQNQPRQDDEFVWSRLREGLCPCCAGPCETVEREGVEPYAVCACSPNAGWRYRPDRIDVVLFARFERSFELGEAD